jgi:hypothetical protein
MSSNGVSILNNKAVKVPGFEITKTGIIRIKRQSNSKRSKRTKTKNNIESKES